MIPPSRSALQALIDKIDVWDEKGETDLAVDYIESVDLLADIRSGLAALLASCPPDPQPTETKE